MSKAIETKKTMEQTDSNYSTAKTQAKAIVTVALALTLLVDAAALAGYVDLPSLGREICAGVAGLVGLWTLVANTK